MATLPQLVSADTYVPCDWDLRRDALARALWVDHFIKHLEPLTINICRSYPEVEDSTLAAFREAYIGAFRQVGIGDEDRWRIDIYTLDQLRIEIQQQFGFADPYGAMKAADNERALEALPGVLEELDRAADSDRERLLTLGLMAGNLCDAGSMVAMERHSAMDGSFRRARDELPPMPWWRDDVSAWLALWRTEPPAHVAAFMDNSGPDICLGVFPLVRWMLQRGARVTLVANEGPALNDVTCDELRDLVAAAELHWRSGDAGRAPAVIGSGQSCPLVDLSELSAECAEQIADADMIWLHGMGRSVESNWSARFSCDVLRTAVLKESAVARRVGGQLFDCVFRLDRAC